MHFTDICLLALQGTAEGREDRVEPHKCAKEGTATKAQVSRDLILDHSSRIEGKDVESIFRR